MYTTKTIENQLLIELTKTEEYRAVREQYKSLILQIRTYRHLGLGTGNIWKLFKMASKRRILLKYV